MEKFKNNFKSRQGLLFFYKNLYSAASLAPLLKKSQLLYTMLSLFIVEVNAGKDNN